MEEVVTNGFSYVVGAATILGTVIAYLAFRHMTKAKASRTVQNMTDSVDGTQNAKRGDVEQNMKNSKGGKQDA